VSLLAEVVAALEAEGIACALIGAGAMAIRGVARSTFDVDLLAVDPGCLDTGRWSDLESRGARVDCRRGDADDPLAGVVRLERPGDRPVDLVVGRGTWQRRAIERAELHRFQDVDLPVVRSRDLILLKLYAGGTQDAWDLVQLLSGPERPVLVTEVEEELSDLPDDARRLWTMVLASER
jgi:hypothetical protein